MRIKVFKSDIESEAGNHNVPYDQLYRLYISLLIVPSTSAATPEWRISYNLLLLGTYQLISEHNKYLHSFTFAHNFTNGRFWRVWLKLALQLDEILESWTDEVKIFEIVVPMATT